LPHEEVWIALTNHANRLITTQRIGQGGLSASMADIRIILKAAIENNATGVLLAHNHPSGNTKPSQADKQLTEKLKTACRMMDIMLHDHLIIGGLHGEMYSFADEGLL
jgi:DNA repair protein RadC